MQLRFFVIPALDPAAAEAELNALLVAGHVCRAGLDGPDGAPKAPRAAAFLKLWICP